MRLIVTLLSIAMLAACAAKDPNKVTPPKTIGPTTCTDAQGQTIPCAVKKG